MYISLTGKVSWTEEGLQGRFCGQVIVSSMALCGGATYHSGHRLSVSICSLFAVLPGTQLQEHAGNDKSVLWHANDFSEGELKEELFTMRFGSIESKYHALQIYLSSANIPPCTVICFRCPGQWSHSYRREWGHFLLSPVHSEHHQPSFPHRDSRYFLPHMLWDQTEVPLLCVLQICKSFGLPLKRHKNQWQSY